MLANDYDIFNLTYDDGSQRRAYRTEIEESSSLYGGYTGKKRVRSCDIYDKPVTRLGLNNAALCDDC